MNDLFQTKVCGITSVADAQLCVNAGIDAIGLNFYSPSPRSISPELANEIAEAVRAEIQIVGLFVNHTKEAIEEIHDKVQFDFLQLHGDEDPFFLKQLGTLDSLANVRLIKAFRCKDSDPSFLVDYLAACTTLNVTLQAILLDAYQPGAYGGTGHRLDWNALNPEITHFGGFRLILAGGITPANVAEAISAAQPNAVDTASGVECSPGRKDDQLIQTFSSNAKKAFESIA